jgi:hypothetical protein
MTGILETKAEKALILLLIVLIVLVIIGPQGALGFLSGPLGAFIGMVLIIGISIGGWLALSRRKTPKYLRATNCFGNVKFQHKRYLECIRIQSLRLSQFSSNIITIAFRFSFFHYSSFSTIQVF